MTANGKKNFLIRGLLITMVMMYGDQEDQIIILGSDPEPYCMVPNFGHAEMGCLRPFTHHFG